MAISLAAPLKDGPVTVRPISISDVTPTYVGWLRDPEVNRYLETRHIEQTLERVAAFVGAMIAHPDQYLFAICLDPDQKHVGNIKIGPIIRPHALADISLFIGDRSAWARGIATTAIKITSRFAIEKLGLQKLSAGVYEPNLASAKAFLKAGFIQEGVRRRHYRMGNKRIDALEFGLCADDLESKKET
jgi:[ribosomal protein S5]-alanine N-acetyltransferase